MATLNDVYKMMGIDKMAPMPDYTQRMQPNAAAALATTPNPNPVQPLVREPAYTANLANKIPAAYNAAGVPEAAGTLLRGVAGMPGAILSAQTEGLKTIADPMMRMLRTLFTGEYGAPGAPTPGAPAPAATPARQAASGVSPEGYIIDFPKPAAVPTTTPRMGGAPRPRPATAGAAPQPAAQPAAQAAYGGGEQGVAIAPGTWSSFGAGGFVPEAGMTVPYNAKGNGYSAAVPGGDVVYGDDAKRIYEGMAYKGGNDPYAVEMMKGLTTQMVYGNQTPASMVRGSDGLLYSAGSTPGNRGLVAGVDAGNGQIYGRAFGPGGYAYGGAYSPVRGDWRGDPTIARYENQQQQDAGALARQQMQGEYSLKGDQVRANATVKAAGIRPMSPEEQILKETWGLLTPEQKQAFAPTGLAGMLGAKKGGSTAQDRRPLTVDQAIGALPDATTREQQLAQQTLFMQLLNANGGNADAALQQTFEYLSGSK